MTLFVLNFIVLSIYFQLFSTGLVSWFFIVPVVLQCQQTCCYMHAIVYYQVDIQIMDETEDWETQEELR